MIGELLELGLKAAVRAEVAASLAILLVLALRGPTRRLIGPGLAYTLWALPVAAAVASLFPNLSEFMHGMEPLPFAPDDLFRFPGEPALLGAWAAGAALFVGILVISEVRFRRRAARGLAGPAVTGVAWHRLVIPNDFRERFTAVEQGFVLRHERMHIARRDPLANLAIGVIQTLSWFNPLAHLAAACARLDQELACDAAVISCRPESRRAYAETLLKAQLSHPQSPFACAFEGTFGVFPFWAGAGRHPLEVRLAMLARPQPGLIRYLAGGAAMAAMAVCIAAAVWTLSPERPPASALGWEDPPPALAAPPAPPS